MHVHVNQSQAEQTGRRLIRRLHVHVHVNQSQAEQTGRRLARRLARRPPFLPKNRTRARQDSSGRAVPSYPEWRGGEVVAKDADGREQGDEDEGDGAADEKRGEHHARRREKRAVSEDGVVERVRDKALQQGGTERRRAPRQVASRWFPSPDVLAWAWTTEA